MRAPDLTTNEKRERKRERANASDRRRRLLATAKQVSERPSVPRATTCPYHHASIIPHTRHPPSRQMRSDSERMRVTRGREIIGNSTRNIQASECPIPQATVHCITNHPVPPRIHHPAYPPPAKQTNGKRERKRATGEGRLSAIANEPPNCPNAKLTKCPIPQASVHCLSSRQPNQSAYHAGVTSTFHWNQMGRRRDTMPASE
jgi:hypothetical protein